MFARASATALVFVAVAAVPSAAAPVRCESLAPTTAFAPRDNDVSFAASPVGRRVALPRAVARVVRRVGCQVTSREQWAPYPSVFGTVFRIKAPGRLQLYVARIGTSGAYAEYVVPVFFDPKSGAATQRPPTINVNWNDRGVSPRPFVRFLEVNDDGRPDVVVQRTAHNGSSYNGEVQICFAVGKDLSLHPVLSFLAWLHSPTSDVDFERRIVRVGRRRLRMMVFERSPSGRRVKLGVVLLRSPGPLQPFTVEKTTALKPHLLRADGLSGIVRVSAANFTDSFDTL